MNIDLDQLLRIGNTEITFLPHYIMGVGARVFIVFDSPPTHSVIHVTADEARRFAERLKISACQAESKEKNAARRNHPETQKC